MTTDYAADLSFALALADAADALSLPRFGAADLRVEAKPDLTPVSDADLAVETALRHMIAEHRPSDSVIGEEFGGSALAGGDGRRWVLDPIDGTKNYVRGVPIWATLIALFDGPDIVVGVVSAPALARRWWASAGAGAFTAFQAGAAQRCTVSRVAQLADASFSFAEPGEWAAIGRLDRFLALTGQVWRSRGYGDFYSYVLLAQGAIDLAAEPSLSLWDLAAVVPIVTEAGGRFTGLDGAPAGLHTASALASNGLLHAQLLAALGD